MCSKESDIDVQTLNQCVSSKEGELVDQLNAKETIKLRNVKDWHTMGCGEWPACRTRRAY